MGDLPQFFGHLRVWSLVSLQSLGAIQSGLELFMCRFLQRSIECFRVAILIRKGPSALEGGLLFLSPRARRGISGVEDEVALHLKMERQSGGADGSIRTGLYLSMVELSLQRLVITLIHILHSCK